MRSILLFFLSVSFALALDSPVDGADPLPAQIAGAGLAVAPSAAVEPSVQPKGADGEMIGRLAREAGLTSIPMLGLESPAYVAWMRLEGARMRQGWTDQLMRDYRAFFAKIKNQ